MKRKLYKFSLVILATALTLVISPLLADDEIQEEKIIYQHSYRWEAGSYLVSEEASDLVIYRKEDDKKLYYRSLQELSIGWLETEDALYYLLDENEVACGRISINNSVYIFDEFGVLVDQQIKGNDTVLSGNSAGLREIDGFLYYYGTDGNPVSGFVKVKTAYYYFDPTTFRAVCGWLKLGTKYYYFDVNYQRVSGFVTIEAKVYYFDKDGVMLTGWQTISKAKHYFLSNGQAATGLTKIGDYYYGFNKNGKMLTGLQTIDEQLYYFRSNGQMYKGWKTISGYSYYFQSNGQAAKGLKKIGSYYYGFKTNGRMAKGWLTIDEKKYYFNSKGRLLTGWRKISGYYYYITVSEGTKIGKQKIGSYTYYFDSAGRRKSGWIKESADKIMYFDSNGRMLTGWQTISKKTYYFNSEGYATIGMKKIGSNLYYFSTSGVMAISSWQTIDGNTYYFNAKGKAVSGVQIIKGVSYVFDKDTYILMNGFSADSSGNIIYLDANGNRLKDFQWVEGVKYFFNSEGVMLRKNAKKFIDVSEFQTIDWAVLADKGDLDGIIIRIGYTGSQSGKPTIDKKALANIRAAEKYGIPYGVYWFGYCKTTECATAEADFVLKTIKDNGFKPKHQIFYDAEVASLGSYYKTVIPVFGERIEKGGYRAGVYGSLSWWNDKNKLNHPDIKKYDVWVAQWYRICQYNGVRVGWQYSSNGKIAGISGRVDMDLWE